MIRINLLGDEARDSNSSQGIIVGYVASLVGLVLLCVYLNISVSGEIAELTQRREQLDRDLRLLKETTAEVQDLEKRRSELKEKLTVIALLRKSKRGPARVLDEINSAIPERLWLTDIQEKGGEMRIVGKALDPIAITDFSTKLRESEFMPHVRLEKFDAANWRDAEVREFALKLKVNYAGRILPKTASGAPDEVAAAPKGLEQEPSEN
jgi:type IV pilus assembly protein PilN